MAIFLTEYVQSFPNYASLLSSNGQSNTLYLDEETGALYYWDGTNYVNAGAAVTGNFTASKVAVGTTDFPAIDTVGEGLVTGATLDGVLQTTRSSRSRIGNAELNFEVNHNHSTSQPIDELNLQANSNTTTHASVVNGQLIKRRRYAGRFQSGGSGSYYLAAEEEYGIDDTGTISATSMPGKIVRKITPNGSKTPVAYETITNSGKSTYHSGLINTTLGNDDGSQANARFTIPTVEITSSTTLNASHWGKKILFNPSSDITITLPQQSTLATVAGVNFLFENIGTNKITFVKEGAETLLGNIDADAGASGSVFRNTTTSWAVRGGTAVKGFQISFNLETASNNTFSIIKAGFSGTITSISSICRSGTCTAAVAIGATPVTATANSVSTTEDIEAVTGANTFTNANFINVTITSNSSCLNMALTINGTYRENV